VYAYVVNAPLGSADPAGLADVMDCQKECDDWYRSGGVLCNATDADTVCYVSCSSWFWPIPGPWHPPLVLPPKGFSCWPGPCPPKSSGVPSPGGGKPGGVTIIPDVMGPFMPGIG